ncbi:MAG: tail fiber domain-containing protein [Verrucomicrobiota bacterium]|nr:tail fiber domain-containing protein [Verrucomicrobiota bacterium]
MSKSKGRRLAEWLRNLDSNSKASSNTLADDSVGSDQLAHDLALQGNPTAATQSSGNSSTRLATTAFVATEVAALVDSAPGALNTLNELAAAINDDASFSTTITNSIALKAPLASPALTGTPTAPTASSGTNTTQLATTAFVTAATSGLATDSNVANKAPINSPTFTGTPAAPTASAGTNTTQIATTAFVTTAVSGASVAGISSSADATAITIDSNETVLIGTDSGDSFNANALLRAQKASGPVYIQIKTDNDQNGGLLFGDTDDDFRGGFIYENGNDALAVYANDAERMRIDSAGDATFSGSVTVGNGTDTATHIAIKPADDTTAEDLQFYNGTTRVGEIGTQDTTWLRINQETAKNIYTPRYIRADGGYFVDGTSKGINGNGNFIGGTVTTPSLTTETASGAAIFIKDTSGTGATNHNSWLSFRDSGGTEIGYVGYGSTSNADLSVSNYSNGPVGLYGTAISLAADTTITGSLTTEGGDGGGVVRTWPGSSAYAMFGTANMSSSEYAILSDGTNTFIAGGSGGYTAIRYANNQTDQQIKVNSSGITFTGNIIGAGISTTLANIAASGDIYVGVNAESYVRFQGSSGTKYARFYLESDEDVRFTEGGHGYFNGNVIAYSTTIASDAKFKDNVEPLENCLDKVCQMRGVSYTWNEQSQKEGVNDIGVIAQEMAEIYPEIVTEVDGLNERDPHLTVDYGRLTAVLINAVKELRAEVEELKNGTPG